MKRALLADTPWAPDSCLPSQFFADRGPDRPEKKLLVAVLEDAVRCLRHPVLLDTKQHPWSAAHPSARAEAAAWFASGDRSSPFAFLNVCEHLGLSPDWVRRQAAKGESRRSAPFRIVRGGGYAGLGRSQAAP